MRKRGFVSAFLSILVLVSIVLFAVPRSSAQADDGSLNLTTSPLPINLVTDPGQTVTTDLRIRNSGNKTEQLQVGLLKFGANDTTGQPRLADREPGDDYFDWVSFSEGTFTAEPNVWNTIKMTIKVPPEGALGYYYAVTFTRAQAPGATDRGASLDGGTAILVLLEVRSPNALRKLEMVEFKASKSVYEFLPAEFTVTVKNSGNIHLIPSGNVFITKGAQQIAVLDINEARGNTLPDSVRVFPASWNDGFPRYEDVEQDGQMLKNEDGSPKRSLKWNLADAGKLRFGKYKATALVVYDDGEKDVPIEAVITFWVIPWRIIGVGLLIAAVILAGLYAIFKNVFHLGKKLPKKGKVKPAAKPEDKRET